MATERAPRPDDDIPYLDELYSPESDELPPITVDDIAHTVERLEAGHEVGEYTGMRESDLVVLAHLTTKQWWQVRGNPSLLPQILIPTAHA
jgi:hypothetical protein